MEPVKVPDVPNELAVRQEGDICIVAFNTRKIIDELQIHQIGEALSQLVETRTAPKILLDFSQVEHLSSAALSVLITTHRQVADRGGSVVLDNIHPQIYEVFRITQLNKVLSIHKTTQDAVKALRQG